MLRLLDADGQLAVGDDDLCLVGVETLGKGVAGLSLREGQGAELCGGLLVGDAGEGVVLAVDVDEAVDDLRTVGMGGDGHVVGVVSGVVITVEAVPRNLVLTVGHLCRLADVEGL